VGVDFYFCDISMSWTGGKIEAICEEEFMIWCTCSEEHGINSLMALGGRYDGRVMLEVAARMMEQARAEMIEVI